ncbi:MAG TPA: hypothetical protein ENI27_09535 [bacterium]|nr:hypothetical protein [bacterium]
MKLNIFLISKAIISWAFGLAFVIIPTIAAPLFGIQLDPFGALMARWSGAALLGIGLICLFTAKAADTKLQQGIILSLFVADTVGFIIALVGQLSGLMNALGWVIVAVWIILALGLGYFRFLCKGPSK